MCGIVGIGVLGESQKLTDKDLDVFIQLIHADVVRGHHGTGVFSVSGEGNVKTLKVGGPPYHLMTSKEFGGFWEGLKKDDTRILVGHNRYATTGQKITKHAHPFLHKKVVMVHNGTLSAGTKLKDYEKFEVDSEALCSSIADIGIEETLKKTHGAYALVFFDIADQTLNIIRNTERPLSFSFDSLMGRIIIGSEKDMLQWVMKRNFMYLEKDAVIKEVEPDLLYKFHLKTKEVTTTPMKGAKTVYAVYTPSYSGDSYNDLVWDIETNAWIKSSSKKQRGLPFPKKSETKKQEEIPQPVDFPKETPSSFTRDERLKIVHPNGKDYEQSFNFTRVIDQNTYHLERDKKVSVMVSDHVPVNPDQETYVVIGYSDSYPGMRFQFRIKGDTEIDQIFEAVMVEITVQNILVPKVDLSGGEVIVWGNKPIIFADETGQILH